MQWSVSQVSRFVVMATSDTLCNTKCGQKTSGASDQVSVPVNMGSGHTHCYCTVISGSR